MGKGKIRGNGVEDKANWKSWGLGGIPFLPENKIYGKLSVPFVRL